jgi:hypothetical protein
LRGRFFVEVVYDTDANAVLSMVSVPSRNRQEDDAVLIELPD